MIITVAFAIEAIAIKPEKCFRGFNGIGTQGLCVSAAVLHQLSYEDSYAGQFVEFIVPLKGMKQAIAIKPEKCDDHTFIS